MGLSVLRLGLMAQQGSSEDPPGSHGDLREKAYFVLSGEEAPTNEKDEWRREMKKEILRNDRWPEAKGPYSVALTFGDLLFVSGQGPAYPDTGEIVRGGFEEQARVVFENLSMILEDAGSSLDKVLKVTVYLSDMDDFATMNGVYAEYFNTNPPVRTTVEVARLPFDIMLEVDVIAHVDTS